MRVSPNPWSKFIQFVFKIVMTMLIFFLSIYSRPFWSRNKAKKPVFVYVIGMDWCTICTYVHIAQGCSWGNTAFSLITLIYCLYDSQQPNKTYSSKKIHCFYSSILKVTSLLLLFFLNLSSIIPFKVYIIGFITSYTLTYSKLL